MSSTNLLRLIILALVLGNAQANAATIYLRWSGESGNTVELPHLGEADVEVWIDIVDGDTLSGVFFANTATNGLRQVDTAVNLTGWSDGSVDDLLGATGQLVSFASATTNGILTTAGSYLLGTQTIRLETCILNQPLPITIDHSSLWMLEADASQPVWDARYNTTYSGYIAYGDYGNPGWNNPKGNDPGAQPTANPLYVACDVDTQGVPRTAGDCNANGVDDAVDITGGTSADCNANSIPDECDIAGGTSDDCNADGLPDDCGDLPVDIVFIIDISGSDSGEKTQICNEAEELAADLAALDIMVGTVAFLEIIDSGAPFVCTPFSVRGEFGAEVPGNGACGPIGTTNSDEETWGPATAIIAERFRWRPGSLRVIVPISDEGACLGDPCNAADTAAVDNAANVANANHVSVFPIEGAGPSSCVHDNMISLAIQTGGKAFDLNQTGFPDPSRAIAEKIAAKVRARTNDCDGNDLLDVCDIDGGASDCNINGLIDTCETPRTYVDADATGGAKNGTSWADAYTSLQAALTGADSCANSEIWVAEGVYQPDTNPSGSFRLVNGVAVYGGFAGTENVLADRDVEGNPTVLSGDISAGGQDTVHVVIAEVGIDATAVLDGFWIEDGRADFDAATGFDGGGLWVKTGAAPTIRNCTFANNDAEDRGGAAYLAGDATLETCTFVGNGHTVGSGFFGGAIAIVNASPTITDCTFLDNNAVTGGAIHISVGAPQISGCSFNTNGAREGGGIFASSSTGTIADCRFDANSATSGDGGGIQLSNASPTIDRSAFLGNTASGSGGGIVLDDADPTISNSFFGSNGAADPFDSGGGGIAVFSSSNPKIINSVFSDNFAAFGGGVDVFGATAEIINCTFSRNQSRLAGGGGGGGLENSDSPNTSVINCVFRENEDDVGLSQVAQVQAPTSLRLSHTNVQGGESEVDGNSCVGCAVIYARGSYSATNIDAPPQFLDPRGPDGHEGSIDDNLRLAVGSPCENVGSNGAVLALDIDEDADGFDRIAFGTVDMGAYEVFVDCNTNDLADVAELMDANTNGVVDLEDFQHFQLCIDDTGAACLALFDRALQCGVVDLADFDVFENQLTGPPETTGVGGSQAKTLMSPKKRKTGGAWYAKVLDGPPAIETAALTFELQPVGGGEAVTTLAPHTAYELHYTAQAEAASLYFLYAASSSSASGLDLIAPAVTGPWSDDRLFDFEDAAGELALAPNHPGMYRTDSAIDLHYFGPKEKGDAPSSAQACTITTGENGELTLDLHMFQRPREENQPVVIMEASATFAVRNP